MMATINPLGERARGNRWWRTAAAFTAGCVLGGWALGAIAGTAGSLAVMAAGAPARGPAVAVAVAAIIALVAGVVELAGWPVPTVRRQVDDAWLARYRGWVYGAGFGAQLGVGLATTVTTVGVYATTGMLVVLGTAGHLVVAQVVGAAFGMARACPVLAGGALRDPDSLRRRAARVAAGATASRLATGASLCALAVWAVVTP